MSMEMWVKYKFTMKEWILHEFCMFLQGNTDHQKGRPEAIAHLSDPSRIKYTVPRILFDARR